MPRYRFAWSNLSQPLLVGLAEALKIPVEPAEGLRKRYGARPQPPFVQDTWPAMLEIWLPVDGMSRRSIARSLREQGLGNTTSELGSTSADLAYLRSCRNSISLRKIVLSTFMALGEVSSTPVPAVRTSEVTAEQPSNAEASNEESIRQEPGRAEAEAEALDDWVIRTVQEAYGISDISRDDDGDLPLPRGSSVMFVRPHSEGSPFLEIFAPLLRDFTMSPAVYEALNSINSQLQISKVFVTPDGSVLIMNAQLLIDTLSAKEFLFAVDYLTGAADHYDTLLQKRFGGATLITDESDAIDV